MGKRHIIPFMRQSALLCFTPNLQKVLLCRAGKITLPLVQADNEQTFHNAILKYNEELGLEVNIRGIVRMETGNNLTNNYYRCIYYGQTEKVNSPQHLELVPPDHPQIDSYTSSLIFQFLTKKQIYHLQLFRQDLKEEASRDPHLQAIMKVAK